MILAACSIAHVLIARLSPASSSPQGRATLTTLEITAMPTQASACVYAGARPGAPQRSSLGLILACGLHAVAAAALHDSSSAQLAAMAQPSTVATRQISVKPDDKNLKDLLAQAKVGDVFELEDGIYESSKPLVLSVGGVKVRAKNPGMVALQHGSKRGAVLYINAPGGKIMLYGLNITGGVVRALHSRCTPAALPLQS